VRSVVKEIQDDPKAKNIKHARITEMLRIPYSG
jgi:hypothetical protein